MSANERRAPARDAANAAAAPSVVAAWSLEQAAAERAALGILPTEHVGILVKGAGKPRASRHPLAALGGLSGDRPVNVFVSINPVSPGEGRGTVADVLRVTAVGVDFDAKVWGLPGAAGDDLAAKSLHAVLHHLAPALGAVYPAFVVRTGPAGGIQAVWRIADADAVPDRRDAGVEASKAFQSLAAAAVADAGGTTRPDDVGDLARVLRPAGVWHDKGEPGDPWRTRYAADVDGYPYAPGWCGDALTFDTITEAAAPHTPAGRAVVGDRAPVPRVGVGRTAEGGDWLPWDGSHDRCHWSRRVFDTEPPTSGRHRWAQGMAFKAAAAHRLGCLTGAGYAAVCDELAAAQAQARGGCDAGEAARAAADARRKVEGWPWAELLSPRGIGAHTHRPAGGAR